MKAFCNCYAIIALCVPLLYGLAGCHSEQKTLLKRVEDSGVTFVNQITENDSMNIMDMSYFYRGGGVAIADLNNDQWPDLILGGNMSPTEIYLNQGGFRFEEVTEEAGLLARQWINGISVADINQDGNLDIYLCAGGYTDPKMRKNLLFVHQGTNAQGVPRYEEQAADYHLDSDKSTTQAVFFDFDKDQDLDVILVNTDPDNLNPNIVKPRINDGSVPNTDQLLENRLDEEGIFVDVSSHAGIVYEGFSLGVAVSDINDDGWPDIYVANDHLSNDLLYINNQDGTFTNRIADLVTAQSYYSMGVLTQDLTNDGLTDIFTLDMLPETQERRQKMMMAMHWTKFSLAEDYEYEAQFMRNTLQVNLGKKQQGVPVFTEVAQSAGLHDTDWSWGCLSADFDLNGYSDIIISNGYARDITDMDFVSYHENNAFFTKSLDNKLYKKDLADRPPILLSNYAFANRGKLQFEDVSAQWGLKQPNLSNGIAYGDLDRDGDLDLVINHINQRASVYRNQLSSPDKHFIKIYPVNQSGIPVFGVKAYLYSEQEVQFRELYPVQGYQSMHEAVVHFGLSGQKVDSIRLVWPKGATTRLLKPATDTVLYVEQPQPLKKEFKKIPAPPHFIYRQSDLLPEHRPYPPFVDVERYPLLVQTYAKEGPPLVTSDYYETQSSMIFTGSGPEQAGMILSQRADGTFERMEFDKGGSYEDAGAAWLDADQDGDLDLYVSSGNAYFQDGHSSLKDRLYLQEEGQFYLANDRIPDIRSFTQEVIATDYDQDGDSDLLVLGRVDGRFFTSSPRSYLLQNNDGKFTDVSADCLPNGGLLGAVSGAAQSDLNGDGPKEIILAGEWERITVLSWNGSRFEKGDLHQSLPDLTGWWQSVKVSDVNQDGWPDILAGNIGTNNPFSEKTPLQLHVQDIDGNGVAERIVGWHMLNTEGQRQLYPIASRDALGEQVPLLKRKFKDYEAYAQARLGQLLGEVETQSEVYEVNFLKSIVLYNLQGKGWKTEVLPWEAQLGPVHDFLVEDFDEDGKIDLMCIGNNEKLLVELGWNNSFAGALLNNTGQGFVAVPNREVGLYVTTQARKAVKLGPKAYFVANYGDSLYHLSWQKTESPSLSDPVP